jgi:lipoprotein-releasing system ATP-binding protein
VLALHGIRKSFNIGEPNEIEILHGIDLTLYAGEFCAVVGPSGSGKSTLLNTVGLLDRPSSGSLSIYGHETTKLSDTGLTQLRGHNIGFVFQYHYLLSAFTALENVMMPMFADAGF